MPTICPGRHANIGLERLCHVRLIAETTAERDSHNWKVARTQHKLCQRHTAMRHIPGGSDPHGTTEGPAEVPLAQHSDICKLGGR